MSLKALCTPNLKSYLVQKGDLRTWPHLVKSIEEGTLFFPLDSRLPKSEQNAYRCALERFLSAHTLVPKELLEQGGLALLTSGSSGTSKLALFSWNRILSLAKMQASSLNMTASSVCLQSLPMHHIAGIMACLRAYVTGACITWDELDASHISWVPTQLVRYLKAPYPLVNLRSLLIGGAPVGVKLKKEAQAIRLPMFESYGLTEAGALVCLDGKAASGISIRLIHGEIQLKGENLFLGYIDREGNFMEHCKSTWFKTGDLGEIDHLGRLKITGRKDNLFISGGENIQPEEVENALMLHPKVDYVCVLPIDDPEFGQRPMAYVSIEEGVDLQDLDIFLEPKLAKFKRPIAYLPWPQDLSKNKLARRELILAALKG
jgi:o-succinylbenzoate---CoA ligase